MTAPDEPRAGPRLDRADPRAPEVSGPPFDFGDRTAVITGAAGAIGAAVARRFAQAGAQVIGLDIRPGGDITRCDVTDEASVGRVLEEVAARHAVTDLVHCAGVLSVGEVLDVPADEIRQVLSVNLMSAFIVAQAAGRLLRPGAAMTFLGSQAAVHGAPGWAAYCAAKAGVARLVEALAKELGPAGIRVNAVCPGTVDSPMTGHAIDLIARARDAGTAPRDAGPPPRDAGTAAIRRRYERGNPLGRMASTDEIAGICLFLSSPLASFVNGASIMVDGGERPG